MTTGNMDNTSIHLSDPWLLAVALQALKGSPSLGLCVKAPLRGQRSYQASAG